MVFRNLILRHDKRSSCAAARELLARRRIHLAGCARVMELDGIDHVALAFRDIEAAARWYIDVLGFEHRHKDMWGGVPLFVGKGSTALALFPAQENARPPSSRADHIGMLHLALRASGEEFAAAQRELTARGIRFAFQDHEVSHSIYFDDLEGNQLEITTYDLD